MLIERIFLNNPPMDNYNYIIACEKTGEALVIDPFDAKPIMAKIQEKGWFVKQVINTHEHGDHTRGNQELIKQTGAVLLAHKSAKGKITGVDQFLDSGDTVKVGQDIELQVLTTPGHTMAHLCLYCEKPEPILISGDTLFNAGVGNCHNGGDPGALYHTVIDQLFELPNDTRVYPGHDYIENNLKFAATREPHNQEIKTLLTEVAAQTPENRIVTTLNLEKKVNPFLRVHSEALIAQLKRELGDGIEVSGKAVFLALRKLRNEW